MNENKMLVDDKLDEFVFRRAWIGSCPVTWADRELSMRIRLIASQGDVPTAAQKEALRVFVQSTSDMLEKCKVLLKPYCERVYGAQCRGKAVEAYLEPVATTIVCIININAEITTATIPAISPVFVNKVFFWLFITGTLPIT